MPAYPNLISSSVLINDTIALLESAEGPVTAVDVVDLVLKISRPQPEFAKLLVSDLINTDPRLKITDEATVDMSSPLVRAASTGPDRSKAMPYRYGFVRATAPLYLRVPTREEQTKSEFQLEDHLRWFEEHKLEAAQTLGRR